MTFEVAKMHKLQDQMESLVYDWVWEDISEQFNVEDVEQLTQEQVDELYEYSDSDACYEGYVGMVIRSICDNWEGMQE